MAVFRVQPAQNVSNNARLTLAQALDIKPELFSETLLAMAGDELRKINACKTPGDKVACVVSGAQSYVVQIYYRLLISYFHQLRHSAWWEISKLTHVVILYFLNAICCR